MTPISLNQCSSPVEQPILFPWFRLKKIANTFDISREKIQQLKNSNWRLQDKCFKRIVKAYEYEEWKKIHTAAHLIFGIRDSKGRRIIDVFTNKQHAPQNFSIDPPENLVFQGGGPKGLAYIGVLRSLEEKHMLDHVKRVAGTSAGAIIATFLALGYGIDEAQQHLSGIQLIDFMDSDVNKNALIDILSCKGKRQCLISKILHHISNAGEYIDIVYQGLTSSGLCKGEVFLKWISQAIKDKSGDAYLTFGELKDHVEANANFKHLHIFATQIRPVRKIIRFSSESKKWKNLVICDAVRASMSLPVAFQPASLRFKNAHHLTSDQEARVFIDGGARVEVNFPLHAFDKKKYIKSCELKSEACIREVNKKTLGFSLSPPIEALCHDNRHLSSELSAKNVYSEYKYIHSHGEEFFPRLTKYDHKYRIVKINNCEVDTFEFNLSEKKTKSLIKSGRKAVEAFFTRQSYFLHILEDPSFIIPEDDLHITEREARKILTFGPRARDYKRRLEAGAAIGGIVTTILSLPMLGIPAVHCLYHFVKSDKSKKFELLALDNSRFKIFKFLAKDEMEKASREFITHKKFLIALMKTRTCMEEFIKCLKNCDNDANYGEDIKKCNNYIKFFVDNGVVSQDLNYYLIQEEEEEEEEEAQDEYDYSFAAYL
jgi:NTE family protein